MTNQSDSLQAAAAKARDDAAKKNKARQADLNHPDPGKATDEARKIDAAKPESEKDAAGSNVHRDNVNPNAYSAESARKPGDSVSTPSINEPKPGEQRAFKVPENHTATTPEALEQAYPDGYHGHEVVDSGYDQARDVGVQPDGSRGHEAVDSGYDEARDVGVLGDPNDPDDLEDEIAQAKEEGDFKSMHRSRQPSPSKKK